MYRKEAKSCRNRSKARLHGKARRRTAVDLCSIPFLPSFIGSNARGLRQITCYNRKKFSVRLTALGTPTLYQRSSRISDHTLDHQQPARNAHSVSSNHSTRSPCRLFLWDKDDVSILFPVAEMPGCKTRLESNRKSAPLANNHHLHIRCGGVLARLTSDRLVY